MSIELKRELRLYKELAARLSDKVELLQAENETAYLEAYQAHQGPHFCKDRPFGSESKEVAV